MAKFQINMDLFFQRGNTLNEATYALTMMALSGHSHCQLANYSNGIQLTVYSHSDTDAQDVYVLLSELLRGNWQGEIQDFLEDDPKFWTTQFTYRFE